MSLPTLAAACGGVDVSVGCRDEARAATRGEQRREAEENRPPPAQVGIAIRGSVLLMRFTMVLVDAIVIMLNSKPARGKASVRIDSPKAIKLSIPRAKSRLVLKYELR